MRTLNEVAFENLIGDLDQENAKRPNDNHEPLGTAQLNAVPSKNFNLEVTDQWLRISSHRLGAKVCKVCEKPKCRREKTILEK